jgi:hypothetical protein
MAVLWYVVFIQFAIIIWLVYDKLKKRPINRGYQGKSVGRSDS